VEGEWVAQLEEARGALATEREQHVALAEGMARLSAAFTEMEQNGNRASADREHLAGQVAMLESNLRQRQEEIEQAWARADELTGERDELRGRIEELQTIQERLQSRLLEADGWVFDLAGERRTLEARLAAIQSKLEEARLAIARIEAVSEFRQQQLHEHSSSNRRILAGVARLQGLEIQPKVLQAQTERLRDEWHEEEHPLADLAELLHRVARSIQDADDPGDHQHKGVAALLEQKAALHKDIEMLMERLEERESSTRQAQHQITVLNQTLSSLRADALEYHSKAAQALEQLKILEAENKQQARALRSAEERAARKDRQLDWMRRLYRMLESGNSGLKGILPPAMRRQRMARVLKSRDHFDGEAYLAKYTDVAEAGMDPLHHYILHGMAEGRFVDTPSQG
jgi:chromosome segregation ATPase